MGGTSLPRSFDASKYKVRHISHGCGSGLKVECRHIRAKRCIQYTMPMGSLVQVILSSMYVLSYSMSIVLNDFSARRLA